MADVMKKEKDGEHPAEHYLVVEDPATVTTWHLQVMGLDGKPDHRLMGGAWAALHGGFRGNKYEGPAKADALAKLKKLYADEEMPEPGEGKALPTESMNEQMEDLFKEFERQFSPMLAMPVPTMPEESAHIKEAFADYVIAEQAEVYYRVPYSTDENGAVTFAPRAEWVEVVEEYVDVTAPKSLTDRAVAKGTFLDDLGDDKLAEALKIGARNSQKDYEHLQTAHDHLVSAGARCGPSGKSIETDDTLITYGEAVKGVDLGADGVKLGGYLVRYSSAEAPDLTGDYFTKDTDFGEAVESFTWFNHRLPVRGMVNNLPVNVDYRNQLSAKAKLTRDDIGVFAEVVLKARDEYEAIIAKLGLEGKLSWSSGTAAHLVDRELVKGAQWVKRWILGLDASLTPTPAEPRNLVMPIKSLFTPEPVLADADRPADEVKSKQVTFPTITKKVKKESDMDETELKAMLEKVAADAATASAEAVYKRIADAGPNLKAGVLVDVVEDESDRAARLNPFKSGGEFLLAVRTAAIAPHMLDKRLLGLRENADGTKATGLNEAIPSQGGFLVPPAVATGLKELMYKTGSLLNLFRGDPVTGNGMAYNIVDETSRADGSRYGGVQGYWLAEGGTKTSSKPKFRQLELKLKKVAALCYATDEILEDATALESWLMRNVPNELRFKVEDAFINGDGVGKPYGILSGAALKSATRVNASAITSACVGNMWAARWAGYDDYVWIGNQTIFPQLLGMTIGNQPVWLSGNSIAGNQGQATLLGAPYFDVEYLPTLGTLGDLLLVSPSAYQVIEKGGIQSASSIHVAFTTDETAFRFVYRIDGAPTWTSTLTGKDGGTYSPYVVLAATT